MKCQDFEATIHGLARGQSVEASARATALAHIGQCARCAAAFDEQRAVTDGVHAVMASLAEQGASQHVEESLRRAFREQTGQAKASASKTFSSWWQRGPRWANVALATTAILLLTLLTGLMWLKSKPAAQNQEVVHQPSAPAGSTPDARKESPVPSTATDVPEQKLAEASTIARHPKAHHSVRRQAAPETEIATRFYSLVEEDEVVPLESGQVVRVEVPASALMALGLPIAAENRDRSVQADPLFGQDGVARAIRFLR
jgi:hypothetical protein